MTSRTRSICCKNFRKIRWLVMELLLLKCKFFCRFSYFCTIILETMRARFKIWTTNMISRTRSICCKTFRKIWQLVLSYCSWNGNLCRFSTSVVNFFKNLLLWNCFTYWNQTWLQSSLGCFLSKLCPPFPTMIQHGRHGYK